MRCMAAAVTRFFQVTLPDSGPFHLARTSGIKAGLALASEQYHWSAVRPSVIANMTLTAAEVHG
jgi:hypothetical protein